MVIKHILIYVQRVEIKTASSHQQVFVLQSTAPLSSLKISTTAPKQELVA